MDLRPFGRTSLVVPALGLGAGPLGDTRLSEADAERLIHAALDLGVTLFDTARSYGASEARIGRALRGRRDRALLSTKVGYGVVDVPDWTADAVRLGIDGALARLDTDVIDIVHLHSCPADVLRRGQVIGALEAAVRAGKVRVAAYSGENDALDEAVRCGQFGSIELSVNPWDQGALDRTLWKAKEAGLGAIAKRPLANAWWSAEGTTDRPDIAEYQRRGNALAFPDFGLAPEALSLRFAVYTWGIDCAIAGTTKLAHLERLASIVEEGPLPPEVTSALRETWRARGGSLGGVI
jgi:aryl-alcohol dehydrogenase-like predicted oxidoreductase